MSNQGYILPAYHFFAQIEEGLPDYETCPVCGMYFTQMSERQDIEDHIDRCVIRESEEEKRMIAAGYKKTSKGWVMK